MTPTPNFFVHADNGLKPTRSHTHASAQRNTRAAEALESRASLRHIDAAHYGMQMYEMDAFISWTNKYDRIQISDALWHSAGVHVSKLSFKWHSFMFLVLDSVLIQHISQIFNSCVMDGRTDSPSYRDMRTHLKTSFP